MPIECDVDKSDEGRAFTPSRLPGRRFDLDVNASGQAQFVQRLNRLGRSLDNINQSFVGPNLVLLTSLLVHKGT
jgi:hypothetical protein